MVWVGGGSRRGSWGPNQGVLGTEVPQWVPGVKPRQTVWGTPSRPEAGAFKKYTT